MPFSDEGDVNAALRPVVPGRRRRDSFLTESVDRDDPVAAYVLAGLTVFTTIQRILYVRGQLRDAQA